MRIGIIGNDRKYGDSWLLCSVGGGDSWSSEVLQIVDEVEGLFWDAWAELLRLK